MTSVNELLTELIARLPELEWKIGSLNPEFLSHSLPRGLFHSRDGLSCVQEIKANIHNLANQKNERSAYYLADQIKHQINTLVILCQINDKRKKPVEKVSFGVKMLSTRQQWIGTLENEVSSLIAQQEALAKTLEQQNLNKEPSALLSLKAELGEVEKRLTLARETLKQTVS